MERLAGVDGSWVERHREQGRRLGNLLMVVGLATALGGGGLVLVTGSEVVGASPELLAFYVALLGALVALHGWRRAQVHSSPSAPRPYQLKAATDLGAFARMPEPRPGFGLRHVKFHPGRAVLQLGVMLLALLILARALDGARLVIPVALVLIGWQAWSLVSLLNRIPQEVRVMEGRIEWRFSRKVETGDVTGLRRLRCNTFPSTWAVLDSETDPSRIVPVIGGFADFVDALTSACPWIEVDEEVLARFGGFSTQSNGFFLVPPTGRASSTMPSSPPAKPRS